MGKLQVCFETVGQDWHLSEHCSGQCWPHFIQQDQTKNSERARAREFAVKYQVGVNVWVCVCECVCVCVC